MCKINWFKIFKKQNLEEKIKELYGAISKLPKEQFHKIAGFDCYWADETFFQVKERIYVTRLETLLTGRINETVDYCAIIDAIIFEINSKEQSKKMAEKAHENNT